VIKIDLHIHTIPTASDSDFTFSIEKVQAYVEAAALDAIAVTNHNVFEYPQFEEIQRAVAIAVLPGIEVNVDNCHILLIADPSRADRLALASQKLSECIRSPTDSISVAKLAEIFGDLSDYMIIPHYEKKPAIRAATLAQLSAHVTAGEVDSPKKFLRCVKDEAKLVPVLFSDSRMSTGLERFPTRSTYVNCGNATFPAIKETLKDRTKVFLSREDGNALFPVLIDGPLVSTGLNVLLGDRSSGKTHTLNRINSEHPNVKYIRQFSLVQLDETQYERDFNADLDRRRSRHSEEYLSAFKGVLDKILGIDLDAHERALEGFLDSLLRSAEETDRADSFSMTRLFSESTFKIGEDKALVSLIKAVRHLIENVDHRATIQKHLDLGALRALAEELIESLWERTSDRRRKEVVNRMVEDIRKQLAVRTSAIQVPDLDLYELAMDRRRVARFEEIVRVLRKEEVIYEREVQGFRVVAKKVPYAGAGELKAASGRKIAFSDAMEFYEEPYQYLRQLMTKPEIAEADLYRFFVRIVYEILNKDGFPVSGGERSEYRLLQEISDAQSFDLLLIDEPESSFDNVFLKENVNALIRDISQTMPVVVVTHNSTVGASLGADYLLCARKEVEPTGISYKVYGGYPTDRVLRSKDGSTISTHQILMDSLEAGREAYEGRRSGYEAVKHQG
jgi:hypothetical protein